ncbi:MAG: hypothetical protein EON59_07370 [Alphaproteobacteria bacterium]|nr:MAG: hypothetical protein EON59_07370 [Alphaproteobacteria bacterium]
MAGRAALIRQSDVTRILRGAAAVGIKMGVIVKARIAKRDAGQARDRAWMIEDGINPDAPRLGRGRPRR